MMRGEHPGVPVPTEPVPRRDARQGPRPDQASDDALPSASREVQVGETEEVRVPIVLAGAAAWCWRILVILAAFVALFELLNRLMLLVIPLLTALLTVALLAPLADFLRNRGLPRVAATTLTMLIALGLLGSVGFYVVDRAIADYPSLADQATKAVSQGQRLLQRPPFSVQASSLNNISDTINKQLNAHRGQIASGVISAGRTALDLLTGLVLWLFLTVVLLHDGARVWDWIVRLFPRRAEWRVRGAGQRAWRTLTGYISGQFIVALFHGVAIGLSLLVLDSPLVAPLAVLVFVGSFIPIIGAIVFGGFAVLVTLVAGGTVKALILLTILVVENQVEGHVLQPFVVGRYVRLHPVAIAVALTAGSLLQGIVGAIFAVPLMAAINASAKFLAGREDVDGNPLPRASEPTD
ncbi:MAG TPA: AI-2E family transporter [Mycobacteriales bacterium]|nr:AI-2E family transporter [Mycobacteriales bacterium]